MEKILTKLRGHHNSDYPLRISYLMKDQAEHYYKEGFDFFLEKVIIRIPRFV